MGDAAARRARPKTAPRDTSDSGAADPTELVRLKEVEARQTELRAAMSAATQILDIQQRHEALASLCYQWAECDPRGALELALTYRLEEAPGAVIENLTQQWAAADLPAAREWIDAQPPSDFRSGLVARVGFLWARSNPEAAAQYVVSKTSPGPIQEEAAISVLHQWAQQDGTAALAWAQAFPPGALRDRALREAAPEW